jgi:hypothetical protein
MVEEYKLKEWSFKDVSATYLKKDCMKFELSSLMK